MKASELFSGTRAVRRVRVPVCNFRCELLPDLPELAEQRTVDRATWEAAQSTQAPPDTDVEVGLRVMTGLEIAQVLREARKTAKDAGVENPQQGDPIYDLAVAVHTLAVSCVDPDAPTEPFFDGGPQQILESPHLGRDGIVYLHELQENWQELCSPQAHRIDVEELDAMLDELAGPEGWHFFVTLRPGMRWSFMRTMAALLVSYRTWKSTPGASGEQTSSETPSSSATPPPAPLPTRQPKRHRRPTGEK